jgi:hypothetical protein
MRLKLNSLWQNGMGNFHHVFPENYALFEILLRDMSISLFINELHGEVHRHEYSY